MLAAMDHNELTPARRLLTGLATLSIMLVIYGSWIPFRFDTALLSSTPLDALTSLKLSWTTLEDAIVNTLIYIPIAVLLSMRMLIAGIRRSVRWLTVAFASALVCILSEGGQLYIPERHASLTDVLFNAVGVSIGVLLADSAMSVSAACVRSFKLALATSPMRALYWLVAVLVVVAKLAPFDFTVRPTDFSASLSHARWSPFDPPPPGTTGSLEEVVELAGSFFAFALLGILGALALRDVGERRSVCVTATIAYSSLLAIGLELVQLVIRSHTCDAADALTYIWGATLGAILGATIVGKQFQNKHADYNPAGKIMLMIALTVQVGMIIMFSYPSGSPWVAPHTGSIQLIPFYSHFQMSFAECVGRAISSFMWYAALATIAAAMMPRRDWYYTFVMSSFLTVGVITLTEALQAFSVTRYADITEPIIALAASLIASSVYHWIQRQRQVSDVPSTSW